MGKQGDLKFSRGVPRVRGRWDWEVLNWQAKGLKEMETS